MSDNTKYTNIWTFDDDEAAQGFVRVLTSVISDDVGVLIDPSGNETTVPAIYITNQENFPEATLPFVQLTFISDSDEDWFEIDSGLLEIANEEDPESPTYQKYHDTYLTYNILVTVQGDNSGNIIRKIRNCFLWDSVKTAVHTEMNSSLQLMSRIDYTPQFIQTGWRQQYTMVANFSTISRTLEPETSVFDTVNITDHLQEDIDTEDLLSRSYTVTSNTN